MPSPSYINEEVGVSARLLPLVGAADSTHWQLQPSGTWHCGDGGLHRWESDAYHSQGRRVEGSRDMGSSTTDDEAGKEAAAIHLGAGGIEAESDA
jgi:hypothetical protein